MPSTTSEILAGRDVIMYTVPFNTGNTFPADSPWGTTPASTGGGAYTEAGYTKDGVGIRWRQQIQEYMVDQFIDPVLLLPMSRDLRFMANIGQVDMPDLTVAMGQGTATSVPSTSSSTGYNQYEVAANASNNYYTVFFDVRNPISNDFAHFVGWFCRGVGDIEIRVHLPDIAQVNVELRALPDATKNPARVAQFRMQTG